MVEIKEEDMEFDEVLIKRVSTRKFKDQPLSDEDIKKLLFAAKRAPIGRGLYEDHRLTVVRNKDFIRAISGEYSEKNGKDTDSLYGAPTIIFVSSKGEDPIKIADTAIILENIALKATDLGIGSCYIWGLVNNLGKDGEYIKHLGLPEGFRPKSAIILGYTDDLPTSKDHDIEANFID